MTAFCFPRLLKVQCKPSVALKSLSSSSGCRYQNNVFPPAGHVQDSRSTPEELFEEEQMQNSVMLVLQELDEREAGIIRMRLGIDGYEVHTLEDIGSA
jgi:DNA-directed RNA polymerase sigma subunit (sigma70/sigma32)